MGVEKARQRIELTTPLTVLYIEHVAFVLAKEWMTFNEAIPDFSTRFPGKLEACVSQPFQTFGGKPLYPTLIKKAAILFYLLIKDHPFQNGNKRVAITSLFSFLFVNDKWLKVDPPRLYSFTVFVAESASNQKEEMVNLIEDFLGNYLTDAQPK